MPQNFMHGKQRRGVAFTSMGLPYLSVSEEDDSGMLPITSSAIASYTFSCYY